MKADQNAKHTACLEQKLKEFEDYDNALTAVAAWRAIFGTADYDGRVVYFDWFPRIPTLLGTKKVDLTPDGAVLLEQDIGIIIDIKASMPQEEDAFDRELEDLMRYDKISELRESADKYRALKNASLVLMMDRNNGSQEIAARIIKKLTDKSHPFKLERQLAIMDFAFMETRGKTFFDIRCVPMQSNGTFAHPLLADHFTIHNRPARLSPTHFGPFKSRYVLMNDNPKSITLLVFLWSRGLYEFLTPGQRKMLSEERTVTIKCSPLELSQRINSLFPDSNPMSRQSAETTLRLLEGIGLAKSTAGDQFEIEYRDLCRNKRAYHQPGKQEHEVERELAHEFANRLCKGPNQDAIQLTLFP